MSIIKHISKLLSYKQFKHKDLGDIFVLKVTKNEDGSSPFYLSKDKESVYVRLTPETAMELAKQLEGDCYEMDGDVDWGIDFHPDGTPRDQ
jgi:hypothetical protein